MQELSPRGEVRRKHGTNVRVDGQKPNRRRPYRTSGQRTAKSIIHQGAKHRFGDCTRKVTELTPGDLFRVASATEVAQRTQGTTDPGGVWHHVHRKECLTILLGTYAENTNPIGTDDDLHCIRYSLLMPALAAAYVVALMLAVRLLLKEWVHS